MKMKQNDRISEVPENFREVFNRQISLSDAIRSGRVTVDQGDAEAKALFGATKSLEGDLHARMFEARLSRVADASRALEHKAA
jgi:hypothetical protein